MCEEDGEFSFEDVVNDISRKMINRHPHVFDKSNYEPERDNWESIKAKEKEGTKESEKGVLGRIPESLPALIRAQKVLKKSEKEYSESISVEESIANIRNNLDFLEKEMESKSKYCNFNKFLGETLLQITNIALNVQENAENSLTKATEQFINKREGQGSK